MFLSNQGIELCNEIMNNLCKLMGIKQTRTTPYHPQCSSQEEVVNKQKTKYLGDFVTSDILNWEAFILAMAFAYNTTMNHHVYTIFLTDGLYHKTPHFNSTLFLYISLMRSCYVDMLQLLMFTGLHNYEHIITQQLPSDIESQTWRVAYPHEIDDLLVST